MLAEVKYCPCQYLFLEAVYADETFSVWLLPEEGGKISQVRPELLILNNFSLKPLPYGFV